MLDIPDHDVTGVIAIIGAFSVAILWTLGLLFIGFIKALKSGPSRKDRVRDEDEARSFQEMQRGFQHMEQRIEALETLILDRAPDKTTRRDI